MWCATTPQKWLVSVLSEGLTGSEKRVTIVTLVVLAKPGQVRIGNIAGYV